MQASMEHAAIIRRMTEEFDEVIVFIAMQQCSAHEMRSYRKEIKSNSC
jgi:phosphopantetheine adenylyltransferase